MLKTASSRDIRNQLVKKKSAKPPANRIPAASVRIATPRGARQLPPVIAISQLTVERDAPILNAVDWAVAHGEHWVILGANGSGKTSLLSTLTGYMPPTTGAIAPTIACVA